MGHDAGGVLNVKTHTRTCSPSFCYLSFLSPHSLSSQDAIGDDEALAGSLFPYLEWWALAHSATIAVHRHEALAPGQSTYSGTAHMYGGW